MIMINLSKTDGNIYRFTGTNYNANDHTWTPLSLADLSNIYWYDLEPVRDEVLPGDLCIIPYLAGGDYSNSCAVEYANYLEWQDLFADTLSYNWWTVSGGYGSYGIAIRVGTENDEILEMIRSLQDYPAISDDRVCEVEMQWQDETYDQDIADDFIRAINTDLGIDLDLDIADNAQDDRVYDLFRECMDRANEYWEVEQHGCAWIDVDKLVHAIRYTDLIPFISPG